MAYYEEDEVQRLITNLAQWNGDGVGVPGCGRLWDEEKIAQRDMQLAWRSDFKIPAIGVDAEITKRTLVVIGHDFRAALWAYYTSSLTFAMQAREILGISKSTYHLRLERAHPVFMQTYEDERDKGNSRVYAYAQTPERTKKL